ncbi:MAG: hypothetical protein MJZ76_07575 [Bacteroidales bacterium]|nr:hypothetical protein [Bacteroidales bacterium]
MEEKKSTQQDIPHFSEKELFPVPEGFFENLSEQTLAAIREDEQKRMLFSRRWHYAASSIAAVALVILAVGFFFPSSDDVNKLAQRTTTNSSIGLKNNLQNNGIQSDTTLLAQTVEPMDAQAIKTTHSRTTSAASVMSNESNLQESCSVDEDEFCAMDYQMIEYYCDELEENDFYDLR